jgi:Fe-S oxidoreductase
LKKYRKNVKHHAAFLSQYDKMGIPILGLDPSLVQTYRDDIPHVLGASVKIGPILDLQDYLVDEMPALANCLKPLNKARYVMMGHCTERSLTPNAMIAWKNIFKALGADLVIQNIGCCGMAGIYGHENENQAASKALFDLSWRQVFESVKSDHILVTGYSCRHQVQRLVGSVGHHPVRLLLQHLR